MARSVTNKRDQYLDSRYSFNRRLKEGRDIGSLRKLGRLFHCLMTVKENEVGAKASDLGTW